MPGHGRERPSVRKKKRLSNSACIVAGLNRCSMSESRDVVIRRTSYRPSGRGSPAFRSCELSWPQKESPWLHRERIGLPQCGVEPVPVSYTPQLSARNPEHQAPCPMLEKYPEVPDPLVGENLRFEVSEGAKRDPPTSKPLVKQKQEKNLEIGTGRYRDFVTVGGAGKTWRRIVGHRL